MTLTITGPTASAASLGMPVVRFPKTKQAAIIAKCDLDMGRISKEAVFIFAQLRRTKAYPLASQRAGVTLAE